MSTQGFRNPSDFATFAGHGPLDEDRATAATENPKRERGRRAAGVLDRRTADAQGACGASAMTLEKLPIDDVLPELVSRLAKASSLVVEAPPGAGKTTRVPRALLDAGYGERGEIVVL